MSKKQWVDKKARKKRQTEKATRKHFENKTLMFGVNS